MFAPFNELTREDRAIVLGYLGSLDREPDLIIAPDGLPYLYRWHLNARSKTGNLYFHLQVADDPERPLHDHPWDNMSVILAGGYLEMHQSAPPVSFTREYHRAPGAVVFRRSTEAHRLLLPPGVAYTLSQFATGPKVRDWGFWYPDGWRNWETVTKMRDGVSVHVHGSDAQMRKGGQDDQQQRPTSQESVRNRRDPRHGRR